MNIACIGGGGHFKVVLNIIRKTYLNVNIGYFDDGNEKEEISGTMYLGRIEKDQIMKYKNYYFLCTIGDVKIRHRILSEITVWWPSVKWLTVHDPCSVIQKDTKIGDGTVIMAGAIIQPGVTIGKHCIINTKSSVDHDCTINDNVHIAPGATLCGGVAIGENTFVGAGCTIVEKVKIGSNNTIGASSLVLNKEKFRGSFYVAYGIPCEIVK